MQLPDDYKTNRTTLVKNLSVSAAAPAGDPFSPFGVSIAMELQDGSRIAAVLTSHDTVIRLVETVLEKAAAVWPEMGDEMGTRR